MTIMDIEVYCDESRPELFTTKATSADRYMLIGSIWIPKDSRSVIKDKIRGLRQKHSAFGEIKWHAVAPSKLDFYRDIVKLFFSEGDNLRFRCILIDKQQVDLGAYHKGDAELGFYKFYYQLLHHWIKEGNRYSIFTDTKTTRVRHRLKELHQILNRSNLFSEILAVQALPSDEAVLIQLADLLVGAVGYCCHGHGASPAKKEIVAMIEEYLGHAPCEATMRDEKKFNIFRIRLNEGSW
ncbi:MAG: hypothetical protein FD164_2182 [Nitrospirae bacterium]|nr:MAG: hypothetical protein FD164_2182 [Nitrospirota bacterium]